MIRAIVCMFAVLVSPMAWSQTAALDDDEITVLASAIAATRLKGTEIRLLIANNTASLRCDGNPMIDLGGCKGGMRTTAQTPDALVEWVRGQFPTASPEVLADFRLKAGHTARVTRAFPVQVKQTLGDSPEPKESSSPDYLIAVSRVGFDSKRTEALAYVGAVSWSDSRLSFGEYVHLRRSGETWSVAGRARNWDMGPK